jgi:DNA repair protein RecN (Recombination protein N)
MLAELSVRDFAIIDAIDLRLAPGFNVLTGETGAGKSILIDAVDLLLGGRADPTFVRAGAEAARIEGLFRLDERTQARIAPILEREGLEGERPDELLLGREIRREGRSICRVNGRTVSLALLKEIGQNLVDIHGQSEHLSLLRVREHLNLLDRYAGLEEERAELAELVHQLRAVRTELEKLRRDERELARRADLLRFQVEEIESARLEPGEEEALLEERTRLANAEQLAALTSEAYALLYEGSDGANAALDLIGQALRALAALAKIDPTTAEIAQAVEAASYQLDDAARTLRHYQDTIEFNPARLNQVEERLDLIRRLKRKYGDSIPDILAYARQAAAELEGLTHSEERVEVLRLEEEALLRRIGAKAERLSQARREAALRLAEGIERELTDLRMAGARFAVDIQWVEDESGVPVGERRYAFDATGIDRVEFLVAPNPGEGLKPLVKIASGGETSRLMLALKTVLSRADQTPTLIFDEIDQGIGGRVGVTVGRKLWGIADAHQVLCVTHLPQLAGYGDAHFKVEKQVIGERTVTRVRELDEAGRVEELAQMLGASGQAVQQSARDILAEVRQVKARALAEARGPA